MDFGFNAVLDGDAKKKLRRRRRRRRCSGRWKQLAASSYHIKYWIFTAYVTSLSRCPAGQCISRRSVCRPMSCPSEVWLCRLSRHWLSPSAGTLILHVDVRPAEIRSSLKRSVVHCACTGIGYFLCGYLRSWRHSATCDGN